MKNSKIIIRLGFLLLMNSIIIGAQQTASAKKTCLFGNCMDGKGKVIYPNGDTYEGDFVNNIPDGFGTFTEINGNIYVGQMSKSEFQGKGKFFWKGGSVYEGDFVKNKRDGHGKTSHADGNHFVGEYIGDWPEGFGKLYDKATNTLTEGIWKGSTLVKSSSVSTPVAGNSSPQYHVSSPQNSNFSGPGKTIDQYKTEANANGHTILASGIYNEIETLQFNMKAGETYVIVAAIEGESRFGIDLFAYPNEIFLTPTNTWEDQKYQINSTEQYALKTKTLMKGFQSILYINFGPTKSSRIEKVRFFPYKNKGLPIYWVMFKVK